MSQVNFFMDENDELVFLNMIRQRLDTDIIVDGLYTSPNPPAIIYTPNYEDSNRLVLSNNEINKDRFCSQKIMKEGKEFYTFALYHDPSIEFSRCHLVDNILVAGRIFAKIGWLKSEEHNKIYKAWYSSIERWIKKNYKKIDSEFWIGESAENWSLNGGKLAFGPSTNALVRSLGER